MYQTENEIVNYFNENKEIYTMPEKEALNNLILNSEEEAEKFKINISGFSNNEIIIMLLIIILTLINLKI